MGLHDAEGFVIPSEVSQVVFTGEGVGSHYCSSTYCLPQPLVVCPCTH